MVIFNSYVKLPGIVSVWSIVKPGLAVATFSHKNPNPGKGPVRIAILRIRCRFPDAVGSPSFLQRSKRRVFEDQAFPSKISEALQSSQKKKKNHPKTSCRSNRNDHHCHHRCGHHHQYVYVHIYIYNYVYIYISILISYYVTICYSHACASASALNIFDHGHLSSISHDQSSHINIIYNNIY